MIPTSIDGTDITGATIDGTDVQEITVDGQTVFTATTLPVAYSNLIGWYPFDSAEYGGSNADDVTAILGGSGDDTAYDGTVSGATYQSGGGVTDINAGANSGAFEYNGGTDNIEFGVIPPAQGTSTLTWMCWFKPDSTPPNNVNLFGFYPSNDDNVLLMYRSQGDMFFQVENSGNKVNRFNGFPDPALNTYHHIAVVYDSGTLNVYEDGSLDGSISGGPTIPSGFDWYAGYSENNNTGLDGSIDDCRIYNTALSASQINQIYQNTLP